MIRSRIWQFPLLILAGIPAFLFAYLGHFGRLILDDYCVFHIAKSMDAWAAIVYHNSTNSASFSRFLLHSLLAPIDELATAFTTLAVVVFSITGLYLILRRVVASLLLYRPHSIALWIISTLVAAASINAFVTPQSFYWYNANTGYALPAAICILYFALLFEIAHKERSTLTMRLAVPVSAAIAFGLGGASEMFVVFQFALLALALVFSAILLVSSLRLRFLSLFLAGMLGTVAALAIHLLSPGTRLRIEDIEAGPHLPIRTGSLLLSRAVEPTLKYLAHQEAFAGFILLFGLGLALTLILYRPRPTPAPAKAIKLEIWPLQLCLLLQLLFVPVLWTHVSDLPQVAGRFSYAFAMALAANALSIAAMATLLLWRRRKSWALESRRNGVMTYSICVLLYVVTLFAMTQVRNIDYKPAAYLFFSSLTTLCALGWQLSFCIAEQRANCFARLATLSFIMPIATTVALVAVSLYGRGSVTERMLAPIAYLQVIPGLIWGAYFAFLLQRLRLRSGLSKRWTAVHGALGLLLAASVTIGIVLGHAKLIPDFAVFAREWDARHQQLLQARDAGQNHVEVRYLGFSLSQYVAMGYDNWFGIGRRCAQSYYEIDNISRVQS